MAEVQVDVYCEGCDCDVEQGEHYIDEDNSVFVVNCCEELVDIATGDTYDVEDLVGLRKLGDEYCIHVHKHD